MRILRWIVGCLVFVALLFLFLQNNQTATLKFYNLWSWEAPLIIVVFIAFAIGVTLGLAAGAMRSMRLKRQLGRMRREQRSKNGAQPADWAPGAGVPGTAPGSGPGFEHGREGG